MITLPNICLIVFTLSQPPTMKQNIKLHFPNFFCSKLFHALSARKDLHLSFCIYSRDLQVKNCNWYLFVCRGPWTKTSQYNTEMCYTTFRSAVRLFTLHICCKKLFCSQFILQKNDDCDSQDPGVKSSSKTIENMVYEKVYILWTQIVGRFTSHLFSVVYCIGIHWHKLLIPCALANNMFNGRCFLKLELQ